MSATEIPTDSSGRGIASSELVADLPLASWHRDRGAVLTSHLGFHLPRTYGDPDAERKAPREGLALVDRSQLAKIELLGADRHRFLNGLCTANILTLESGESVYGLLTERKGGVLADVTVLALPDRLWLLLPPGQGEVVQTHLSRFVLSERVEIRRLDEFLCLSLVGPSTADCLAAQGLARLEPNQHERTELLDSQIQLQRGPWQRVDAFTLWVPASIAEPFVSELVDELGARPVGIDVTEVLRIEAGWPEFGIDYGPENLPQEIGLEEAVDYNKGCYLGQEVIARLHYRGQAARRICPLVLEADSPRTGSELRLDGRACGKLTSVAWSKRLGAWIGLAMLQRRVEEDAWIDIEGGGRATFSSR